MKTSRERDATTKKDLMERMAGVASSAMKQEKRHGACGARNAQTAVVETSTRLLSCKKFVLVTRES